MSNEKNINTNLHIKQKKEYVHNESYMHKLAKETFVEWINESSCFKYEINEYSDYISYEGRSFVEYPVVTTDEDNSLDSLWDEMYDYYPRHYNSCPQCRDYYPKCHDHKNEM